MRWMALLLALMGLLSACGGGGAIPAEYLKIEVNAPGQVTTGEGFPLSVTRIWSKDLVPDEAGEDLLPPLHLEHQETLRRENDTHVMEVRRYLAYGFTTGDQEVYAPSIAASPVLGGSDLKVEGNRLALTINGTLDPAAPGKAELPGELLRSMRPWRPLLVILVTAMVVITIARRRRKVAVEVTEEEPETETPPLDETTLAELGRLRASAPKSPAEIQAFSIEVTTVIRRFLGDRFSFDARLRTTEELELRPDLQEYRSNVRDFLGHADLVKFARHDPTATERMRFMDSAESLVRQVGAPRVAS